MLLTYLKMLTIVTLSSDGYGTGSVKNGRIKVCKVRTLDGGRRWPKMSKESLWYVLPDLVEFAFKLKLSTILYYVRISFP